jgi:hypothetical protein
MLGIALVGNRRNRARVPCVRAYQLLLLRCSVVCTVHVCSFQPPARRAGGTVQVPVQMTPNKDGSPNLLREDIKA